MRRTSTPSASSVGRALVPRAPCTGRQPRQNGERLVPGVAGEAKAQSSHGIQGRRVRLVIGQDDGDRDTGVDEELLAMRRSAAQPGQPAGPSGGQGARKKLMRSAMPPMASGPNSSRTPGAKTYLPVAPGSTAETAT